MFNMTLLVDLNSLTIHNLDRDVSFANNHGFAIGFRRRMRPRRVHRILTTGINRSTGISIVTVKNSKRAMHVDAGCHVSSSTRSVSARVTRFLCRTFVSTGLLDGSLAFSMFVSHSGRCNNSVVDSRGMNPDVTSSVLHNTV